MKKLLVQIVWRRCWRISFFEICLFCLLHTKKMRFIPVWDDRSYIPLKNRSEDGLIRLIMSVSNSLLRLGNSLAHPGRQFPPVRYMPCLYCLRTSLLSSLSCPPWLPSASSHLADSNISQDPGCFAQAQIVDHSTWFTFTGFSQYYLLFCIHYIYSSFKCLPVSILPSFSALIILEITIWYLFLLTILTIH